MTIHSKGRAKRIKLDAIDLEQTNFFVGYSHSKDDGSCDRITLFKIYVQDIGGGCIDYILFWRDGGDGREWEEYCTFGGTFWIEWERQDAR